MQIAPLPFNEKERLERLQSSGLLDSERHSLLDDVVELAQDITGCAIALISLVDSDRQWFISSAGVDVRETGRDISFCAHTILTDSPLIVSDTLEDERFAGNPLVTAAPNVRSYLGIPLSMEKGIRIGTLCVLHVEPKNFAPRTVKTLTKLAQHVERLISQPELNTNYTDTFLQHSQKSRAQKEAEILLRQVFDTSRIGTWSLDLTNKNLIWDAHTKELHCVSDDFVPNVDTAIDFYTDESRPIVREALEHAVQTGEGWDLYLDLLPKHGRKIRVRATGSAMMENGEVIRLVGLFQDVTQLEAQRAEYERALHEAETAILDLTNVQDALQKYSIVAISNAEGIYTYANEAFLRATDCGYAEILGRNAIDLLHRYNDKSVVTDIIEQTTSGIAWSGRTAWGNGEDRRWSDTIIVPISSDDGGADTYQYLTLAQDVTEFIAREQQLESRSKSAEALANAKTIFLAKLGHEIRTPLNALVALSAAFERTNLTDDQRHDLDLMATSGKHLSQLLGDILEVSAIETGLVTLRPKRFNLATLISDSIRLFRQQASDKGLDLNYQVATSADQDYFADADRVRQIISNLISNAIKFTQHGSVSVVASLYSSATDPNKKRLRLEVTDSGDGIAIAERDTIFAAFKQGETASSNTTGGVGLGLWLSKQICEAMQGSLELVRSDEDGTTFAAELIIETAEPVESDLVVLNKPGAKDSNQHCRVLAAEDHSINQRVLSVVLDNEEHDLTIVANGREAVDRFKEGGFDIILMDLQMPEMDGFQAITEIRSWETQNSDGRIPIIAVSAHGTDVHIDKALECGADAHLLKPYTPSELIDKIDAYTFIDE